MSTQRTVAVLTAVLVAFGLGSGGFLAAAQGAEKAKAGATPPKTVEKSQQYTFLGVGVEAVSPALVSHLPKMFTHGQGLVVTGVAAGSPAAKGGLKVHDILMCFGDQKLFSPRQLAGLVRQEKAGHEVALSIVREGKPLTVKVTLGAHEVAPANAEMDTSVPELSEIPMPRWLPPGWQLPHRFVAPKAYSSKPQEWASFDSMSVKKLDKNRFHVEIQYLNTKGGLDHKTFEGSREKIHKAILAQKDLPAMERRHLLRSLDMPMAEAELPAMSTESEFKDLEDLWDRAFPEWAF
jgi:hypothetical protein